MPSRLSPQSFLAELVLTGATGGGEILLEQFFFYGLVAKI